MINHIIAFSIKNKALIGLMIIGLIIGGIYSITKIPLDAVPDITNNQVQIITTAPNLGTEDIERFVTYQVELAVANLPGVEEIRSVSRFGLSVVTIVFKDDMGTFLPRQLVNEALIEIREKIPEGFGEPFMAPISTGLGEIYQYTLEVQPGYDTLYNDMQLRSMQEWIVKRQMAMLPGVVEVNSFGGRIKQYEVAVNPDKLRSMGLTIPDVFSALEKNNKNTGGAYIEKNFQANYIRGEGLMRSLDDVRNTLVTRLNGQPVFIRDIAKVSYGSFLRYGAFTKDGKGEAVGGIVMMLKGENSNEVINRVKERIKLIQKSLPEGVQIKAFLDRSKLIKSTTATVTENLLLGALIVIFVLVLFLGNLRGGLIVASVIPLALLFAFILMYLFDVWANLMSLGALDFGILVDGAVIIVEAMIFYMHKNRLAGMKLTQEKRDEIAYNSASKMMNAAFFGQLIILIVFIPVLSLQGVEGKMFTPMAMTFSFAVLGVVVLSLTYVPVMAALFINAPTSDKLTWGEKLIKKIEQWYSRILEKLIQNGKWVIGFALLLLLAGFGLFSRMGAEFIPKLDEGDFAFQAFLKPGTSLTEVKKATTKIEQIVLATFPDEVASIQSRIGVADLPTDPMPIDIADIFVILRSQNQWTKVHSKAELIEAVKKEVSLLPGINYEFSQPVEMRFNELLTGIREDVAVKLYGDDLNILAEKAQEISQLIAGVRGVESLKAEAVKGLPQITVHYNRAKLASYGLQIDDLNRIIETAFSGGIAGSIYEGEKMFDLVVRLDKKHRKSIDDIKNLYISLDNARQIPLSEVAEISYQPGPMQISRDNTNRRIYVGINVKDRDVKSLVDDIKLVLDEKLSLPAGYYIRYGGAFENLQRATQRLTVVVPMALLLIFILVFFAVKSFKQSLMIYLAVPFAAVGGVFSLYLFDMPLSISAGIGFIVLFGVAVLNGLVLISGFNELKAEGKYSIDEVIKKGAVRRIRPILLTASTDILGFLPMAVSTSAGAEVQRPLASVVIGGMFTATLLTLFVLPVLYRWLEKDRAAVQPSANLAMPVSVVLYLIFSGNVFAQTQEISLQQAIDLSLKNHPDIKVADLKIQKQKQLKSQAYDLGTTRIFTGKEEVGNGEPGTYNQLGFEQSDIDLFGISAKSKLANARIDLAKNQSLLARKILIKNVKTAWYKALYLKKKYSLYRQFDTLYQGFLKATESRLKAQTISGLDALSAKAVYQQLQLEVQNQKTAFELALLDLNKYLYIRQDFDIAIPAEENLLLTTNEAGIGNNPYAGVLSSNEKVAEMEVKRQQAKRLPKFNFSYVKQSIGDIDGFYTWQVGLSIPLSAYTHSAGIKAGKTEVDIRHEQTARKMQELALEYQSLQARLMNLTKKLQFYQNTALPLASQQISATRKAYQAGNIGYMSFIKNMEQALQTRLDYLEQAYEYQSLLATYEFITGK